MIANSQKLALHPKSLSAIPEKMLPKTKPTGFPALKQANALFFRFEGTEYAAPSIPTAGGTAAAPQSPKIPQKTSRYMAFVAKPAIRDETEKAPIAEIKRDRRPNVSATLAKKRRNAPELSLFDVSIKIFTSKESEVRHTRKKH